LKLVDEGSSVALQPAWASRDLTSPVTPLIINGVVFALSTAEGSTSGNTRSGPAAQRSAALYALDAATGKELWNSGSAIASSVRGVAPSGGDGQVYVVTSDGALYTFGIPTER
jgi:outer membrane protein assembly factor BamB